MKYIILQILRELGIVGSKRRLLCSILLQVANHVFLILFFTKLYSTGWFLILFPSLYIHCVLPGREGRLGRYIMYLISRETILKTTRYNIHYN